jgi:hypothetical protein
MSSNNGQNILRDIVLLLILSFLLLTFFIVVMTKQVEVQGQVDINRIEDFILNVGAVAIGWLFGKTSQRRQETK